MTRLDVRLGEDEIETIRAGSWLRVVARTVRSANGGSEADTWFDVELEVEPRTPPPDGITEEQLAGALRAVRGGSPAALDADRRFAADVLAALAATSVTPEGGEL